MKAKRKRPSRFANLTDDKVQQQWQTLRPRATKATLFFIVAAISLFLGNHFFPVGQTMTNIINVAFQICCVFSVCGTFIVAMSLINGRAPAKKSVAS